MRKTPILSIFLLCLCVASPILAQEMSLSSCLKLGLKNNFSLQLARGEEQKAANNVTRANAGYLPTVSAQAGYTANLENNDITARGARTTSHERNAVAQTFTSRLQAEWTLFDGFKIQATWQRLQELKRQGSTQTRIAIENYMADLASEYYNYVQQRLRERNLLHATALSRERLRIVRERWLIGSNSHLDLKQAQVDFNADSAQCLKQQQALASSAIRLRELLCLGGENSSISVADTSITLERELSHDTLLARTMSANASLLQAESEKRLAEIDFKSIRSRDYPYLKLNAGYGYTYNRYNSGATSSRQQWGGDVGVTLGIKLFDGQRQRERRNAHIDIDNAELNTLSLKETLRADVNDLWQSWQNNLRLLALEEENVITARENHAIACERFMLGDLSGIEMREAQQSLLDAEERILVAEYNTKICEISLMQVSGGITRYLRE